jgi:FkbH-like protein
MQKHPEMLIRPDCIAAYRINWRDKAQNIVEIARELNLGLQSVVFIDDNPVERGRVREALPEVFVPEWPEDQTAYVRAFQGLRCFDVPRLTDEDARRGELYATERERSALRDQFASLDEWLSTLAVRVRFERLAAHNLSRTVQLLNKTNQMNLRTRRLSEPELLTWSSEPNHELWAVHVADRFGDAGLTGILGLRAEGGVTHVEDYVLSCRVMGRRVEDTLVWAAVARARALGAPMLSAQPLVTAKNKPCLDFFEQAGLERRGDALCWSGDTPYPQPRHIVIEGLPATDQVPVQASAQVARHEDVARA